MALRNPTKLPTGRAGQTQDRGGDLLQRASILGVAMDHPSRLALGEVAFVRFKRWCWETIWKLRKGNLR
jgi:hypothetical protein